MSDGSLTGDKDVVKKQPIEVTINSGFERSINVNYNGWRFPATLFEKHTVASDEEEGLLRRKGHLRCVRAVYSDIVTSYPVITSSNRNPGVMAQWELVLQEAEAGLKYAIGQLEALEK